jgi:hypothetical protein
MLIDTMLEYDFMRSAFLAGGIVAVVSGAVGSFLVMRNLTFAGHALSHVGFAGATGSALLGMSPLWGLLAFTLAAAIAMGALGDRQRRRRGCVKHRARSCRRLGFGVRRSRRASAQRRRHAVAVVRCGEMKPGLRSG